MGMGELNALAQISEGKPSMLCRKIWCIGHDVSFMGNNRAGNSIVDV